MTTDRATRRPAADDVLTAAVDDARAAAAELAGSASVGDHLGVTVDEDRLATHSFACRDRGYRGWRWAVTVSRAPRSRKVTVDEVVLLPGAEALLSPEWVPWSSRLAPGDVGVGDLLVTESDDERLEPGYAGATGLAETLDVAPDEIDRVAVWELGLGRERVLSPIGRDDAVDRWYTGARGPEAPMAQAAPAHCATCGFLLPLAGSLRRMFGVCANVFSPEDAMVVSVDHGCGAHSEVATTSLADISVPLLDEIGYDVVELHDVVGEDVADGGGEDVAGGVSEDAAAPDFDEAVEATENL